MATMHPAVIVFDRSEAERKVFTALERALPNSYHALHHVGLLKIAAIGKTADAEIDFVVVHPEGGVLVLEVKGGLVSYNPANGRWSSQGSTIRDPVDQAVDAKYGLARWLSAQAGWRPEWGPFGHAVVFPDGVYRGAPLPKVDRRIVFDADDLADRSRFRARLENAFGLWKSAAKLGTVGCAFVVSAPAEPSTVQRAQRVYASPTSLYRRCCGGGKDLNGNRGYEAPSGRWQEDVAGLLQQGARLSPGRRIPAVARRYGEHQDV